MNIKHLPLEDRPKEKLMQYGAEFLTHAELLALILHTGLAKKTVLALSHEIFSRLSESNIHPLVQLMNMSLEELCRFEGIGKTKAVRIKAALELGRRMQSAEKLKDKSKLNNPERVANYMQLRIGHLETEQVYAVYLNIKNETLDCIHISKGSRTQADVNKMEICHHAVRLQAAHVILVHNHPSGDLLPSQADLNVTQSVYNALRLLEVRLLDHLIVSKNAYYSIREKHIDYFV